MMAAIVGTQQVRVEVGHGIVAVGTLRETGAVRTGQAVEVAFDMTIEALEVPRRLVLDDPCTFGEAIGGLRRGTRN